ncbi:hypothetical protein BN874_130063 [Candidatus Contendobacter odensis Run_B_J11]|uniref:Uncharacterized protein n=1 Tax=Candidatus Contendobacter odensis Run_B_J11 TaxID=1400861 RepID=A0A7U7G8M8_9GAMM|nr:hypothetical protein BN874_130063 [Candidatus Contendobacter odensis Run_B_J11]
MTESESPAFIQIAVRKILTVKRGAGEKTALGRDGYFRRGCYRLERNFRLPLLKSDTRPSVFHTEREVATWTLQVW